MAMADKVYSQVGREAPRESTKIIELSRNAFAGPEILKHSGLKELGSEMADDLMAIQSDTDSSTLRQNLISSIDKWRGRLEAKITELQSQVDEGKLSRSLLAAVRNRLDIGLYRLERLVDILEPAEKKQKEQTEKIKAVDKARASVKETLDPGVIEREKIEKEVLDAILRDGASQMHTSLRSEVLGKGYTGLQTHVDKKFGSEARFSVEPSFQKASGGSKESDIRKILNPLGINEVVDFNRVQEDVVEYREVEVAKSGLAGMLGQKEKRTVPDKTGTRTVMHSEKVAGGKQEALEPMELMKTDPAFVRKMVEQAMLKQQGIPEAAWKSGEKNNGYPLRPPYEKWRAQHEGKSNVYVRGDLDGPNDYKIHNENIFSVE